MKRPVYSHRASNFLAQARSAEQSMQQFYDKLREEGWVFDEQTQIWTNPMYPGASIMR